MTLPGFSAQGSLGRRRGRAAVSLTALRASGAVVPAIDSCHATEPVTLPDGSTGVAYAACSCGCWATTHDAGCFSC